MSSWYGRKSVSRRRKRTNLYYEYEGEKCGLNTFLVRMYEGEEFDTAIKRRIQTDSPKEFYTAYEGEKCIMATFKTRVYYGVPFEIAVLPSRDERVKEYLKTHDIKIGKSEYVKKDSNRKELCMHVNTFTRLKRDESDYLIEVTYPKEIAITIRKIYENMIEEAEFAEKIDWELINKLQNELNVFNKWNS